MKTIVQNLLIELTTYGKKFIVLKILKKAENRLGGNDTVNLTSWLMQWHKNVKKGFLPFEKDETNFFEVGDLQPKYEILFSSCPELSEIYELQGDEIYFNPLLTEAEKQEIIDYVDDNYKIILHRYGRRIKPTS